MSNNIRIEDISQLIKDGSSMMEYAALFKKEYNNIYDTVDALMESWKGQSSEKYLNNINSFKADLETFIKLLDGYGELYKGVGEGYAKLEEEM